MGAQRLETGGIQQETTLAGGVRSSARAGAAGLREGNLLVLAQEGDFALREAQLRVGDGGGHHTILTTWSDQRDDAHGTGGADKMSAPCRWRLLWR